MRAMILAGVALAATLAGCDTAPSQTAQTNVQAVTIAGKVHRCLKTEDTRLSTGGTGDVSGDIRRKLLTPEALAAGVRVYVSGSDVNNFGSVVIHYATPNNSCLLWSETIPLQEYSQRLDLNPVGVSPFFEVTPAPKPTPTATPTPAATTTPVINPPSTSK